MKAHSIIAFWIFSPQYLELIVRFYKYMNVKQHRAGKLYKTILAPAELKLDLDFTVPFNVVNYY